MYMQISTKCNMKCAHCCYSCNKNGKHMDRVVWQNAISFASGRDDEAISIGGGEPTLHPDFFEILERCLNYFDYVWMATNGSKTKTMWKLSNIMDGEYYEETYPITIQRPDQLCVDLSLDYFHDPIDEKIEAFWKMRSKSPRSNYQIRDITQNANGPVGIGRAKKTGSGWATHCVCADLLIRPDGKIKVCGCPKSPVIGDVYHGIEDKWKEYLCSEEYNYYYCYFGKQKDRDK